MPGAFPFFWRNDMRRPINPVIPYPHEAIQHTRCVLALSMITVALSLLKPETLPQLGDLGRQVKKVDRWIADGAQPTDRVAKLLTIARAMVEDAPILILDEATSSVDTRTEELIQKAMDALTVGRTSFVIAHRLSTIRDADMILVMNGGDIVERGTHEELLDTCEVYRQIAESQLSEDELKR